MYEIGKVYIWQNQAGAFAALNGTETTVIGPPMRRPDALFNANTIFQETDTPPPDYLRAMVSTNALAGPGDLRPKDPPPGERTVRAMFKLPEPVLV